MHAHRIRGNLFAALCVISLAACGGIPEPLDTAEDSETMPYTEYTLNDIIDRSLLDEVVVLDVRSEREYEGPLGHIESAILVPLPELADRIDELEPYRDQEILIVCRTQERSRYAAQLLAAEGFDNLAVLLGGMRQWNAQADGRNSSVEDNKSS